ncbi:FAD-binding oxidoreductase [bacterium]|nr:FAD-binding oxidoreductase [bacterium]
MSRFRDHVELQLQLRDIFGPAGVSRSPVELAVYSRAAHTAPWLALAAGESAAMPDFVVWPDTVVQISRLMHLANKRGVPVIPYGGGSSFAGDVTRNGGIVCDLKRLSRVLKLDPNSHIVSVQAGIVGEHLENYLARRGFTLGSYAPELRASTIGGFLARRGAGYGLSRYGGFADMAVGLQAILPSGAIVKTRTTPRSATGPDFNAFLTGQEGALAIITRAKLRVWPIAPERRFFAYRFPAFEDGVAALRSIVREGLRPAAARLTDENETIATFGKKDESSLTGVILAVMVEGDAGRVEMESHGVGEAALRARGVLIGDGPARTWFESRHSEMFRTQPVFSKPGAFIDRVDVSATWSLLPGIRQAVAQALAGNIRMSSAVAHPEMSGASLTFWISGEEQKKKAQGAWRSALSAIMEATIAGGGAVVHHRAAGNARAEWVARQQGATRDILVATKKRLDPGGVMHPGWLGLK